MNIINNPAIFRVYCCISLTIKVQLLPCDKFLFYSHNLSVADPDLQMGGGGGESGHPDTEIEGGGGSKKIFFVPLGLSLVKK